MEIIHPVGQATRPKEGICPVSQATILSSDMEINFPMAEVIRSSHQVNQSMDVSYSVSRPLYQPQLTILPPKGNDNVDTTCNITTPQNHLNLEMTCQNTTKTHPIAQVTNLLKKQEQNMDKTCNFASSENVQDLELSYSITRSAHDMDLTRAERQVTVSTQEMYVTCPEIVATKPSTEASHPSWEDIRHSQEVDRNMEMTHHVSQVNKSSHEVDAGLANSTTKRHDQVLSILGKRTPSSECLDSPAPKLFASCTPQASPDLAVSPHLHSTATPCSSPHPVPSTPSTSPQTLPTSLPLSPHCSSSLLLSSIHTSSTSPGAYIPPPAATAEPSSTTFMALQPPVTLAAPESPPHCPGWCSLRAGSLISHMK